MSVQDMINASPLGPILDTPVADVLNGLGLPPLPQLPALPPLPGLPPLPPINLDLLIKPLTDLLGGFGTGNLSGADFDPSQIFSGLSEVLNTSMQMGTGAVKAADQLWMGQSSIAAAGKSAQAGADTAVLSTQGTGISFDINAAAGIVGAGLAAVQAIIGKTIALITGTIPIIMTPIGQGMAVGFASSGLAEATTAVAATRAQLLAPTTHMTANGAPVKVTGAPGGAGAAQSPFAVANTVLESVTPAVSSVTELPSMIAKPVSTMLGINQPDTVTGVPTTTPGPHRGPDGGGGGGGGGKGGAGGIGALGGIGGMATQLAGRPAVSGVAGATEPAGFGPSQSTRPSVTTAAPMPGSMAPMSGAGAARGAGASDEQHEVPDYLVTQDHGQQVVGEVPDVAPPVLGHDEPAESEPAPDIELRLGPPAGDAART
nr:hypothetical protein [Gordonia soli]